MEVPQEQQPQYVQSPPQPSPYFNTNQQQPASFPMASNQYIPNTVIVRNAPESDRIRDAYPAKCGMGLAITQVVIGILCIIFHILLYVSKAPLAAVSHGIWCGLFFIMTGIFGIVAAKKRTMGFIMTFMVLSIVSVVIFTVAIVTTSSIDLILNVIDDNYHSYRYDYIDYPYYYENGTRITDYDAYSKRYEEELHKDRITNAADGALIALGVIEFVIGIISAAMCCRGICCCREQPIAIGSMQYTDGQIPQVVVLQAQQGAVGQGGIIYVPQMPGPGIPANNAVEEPPKQAPPPYSAPTLM